MTAPTRPVLRYYGGKWMLAPWIISHFPPHRIYVEPYGGAASVLLRKPRSYAEIYNDLESQVVEVFKVLRDPVKAARLQALLKLTPYAREEWEAAQKPGGNLVERARRTIIRSFMGYGSDSVAREVRTGFRPKSHRSGSAPCHDWMRWPDTIPAFVERLRGVVIECRDALDCFASHDRPNTLFYVDPPYVQSSRRSVQAKHGYTHEMNDQDHRELAEVLHAVEGLVVLSGYPSALYEELYADWTQLERPALADGARPSTEVLWMNPAAEAGRAPLFAALENQ